MNFKFNKAISRIETLALISAKAAGEFGAISAIEKVPSNCKQIVGEARAVTKPMQSFLTFSRSFKPMKEGAVVFLTLTGRFGP
jgi:hypothetical protein